MGLKQARKTGVFIAKTINSEQSNYRVIWKKVRKEVMKNIRKNFRKGVWKVIKKGVTKEVR